MERLCRGDRNKMAAFIDQYLSDSPALFRMLEAACDSGDARALANAAHDLRPHVHFMGAKVLLDLLVTIDRDARQDPPVVRADLVKALLPMVSPLDKALRAVIHFDPGP